MLPLIKENNIHYLNISAKLLKQNINILKELSSIKSLTLRISSESEGEVSRLRNLFEEAGNCFNLTELILVNVEKSVRLLIQDDVLAFIKA